MEKQLSRIIKSDKKYTVAVILSGIFGIFGVHHFYCGRISHGIFDLCLSLSGFFFIYSENVKLIVLGLVLLAIDLIHTIIVTFMLLVGSYKDGQGKTITYPGQKLIHSKEIK